MSKKFRLLMALVLVTGLFGGLLTGSTVSADPDTGDIFYVPRVDKGTLWGETWDTTIHIQNVGTCGTTVSAAGASMWVRANGVWTLHDAIPDGTKSAIVTHVEDEGCTDAELAVTVDRWGPDPSGECQISSSYTGISSGMLGTENPAYEYYAPYVMHGYHNLDTTITIQSAGDFNASVWIYYKSEANCESMKAQHIELITPGQAIRIGPGPDADMGYPSPEIGSGWLGSAYVTSNVPLAIIVDQLSHTPSINQGTLLTMRGMPYWQDGEGLDVPGEDKWYADLLYRENSGWTSSIQVQNLTRRSVPAFVTVDFFDQSGDEILFVGDWVCRNAATTFYLPAIVDLGINFPFGYVGAAEIESHEQIDYPGGAHAGEPIFAVVDIKKTKVWDSAVWRHTFAGETQGGAYNAHPEHQKVNAWGWAMPLIAKQQLTTEGGVTSRIAIRNNSNCNKINGNIFIRDQTSKVVATIPVPYLHPKHMKVFDLNYFGHVYPGFVGAATFEVGSVEQLCDTDGDGQTDIEPVMPSVVVLNYGYPQDFDPFKPPDGQDPPPLDRGGDLTRVYEAIPFGYAYSPCIVNFSGTVVDEALDPILDATVSVGTYNGDTGPTGYYSFDVPASMNPDETFTVEVEKSGYTADPVDLGPLYCDDQVVNFQVITCNTVTVSGYVEDKETGLPIEGATVSAENGVDSGSIPTDENGLYSITLDFDPDATTWVIATATGYNGMADSVFIPCGVTAQVDFQLHQDPKSRILLYYGNGGEDDGTGYNEAQALFEELTNIVDYTDVWPTDPDLEEYKVIFLLGPGNANGDPASDNFTPYQITQMDAFLRKGGRLVVMTDGGAAVDVENDLLWWLNDLQLWFNANSIANALANDITVDQLTADVATLDFGTATDIVIATGVPGDLAALPGGEVIVAADTMPGITRGGTGGWGTGFAGDVVIIGDLNWMDDASAMGTATAPNWPADNENLLLNIITF